MRRLRHTGKQTAYAGEILTADIKHPLTRRGDQWSPAKKRFWVTVSGTDNERAADDRPYAIKNRQRVTSLEFSVNSFAKLFYSYHLIKTP